MDDLKTRLSGETFTDRLMEDVVRSNTDEIFLLALARPDCPAELLVDLSQAPTQEVRLMVAGHPNTPGMTRARLQDDQDSSVAAAAKEHGNA